MKLIGGDILYYAGRPYKSYNNCFLLRAEEDTREEWSKRNVASNVLPDDRRWNWNRPSLLRP